MTREEADEQLRKAIIDHAVAYDIADPDEELLNDYGIVAHWQKLESDGHSRYTTQFHHDNVPHHVAKGLFSTGISLLEGD